MIGNMLGNVAKNTHNERNATNNNKEEMFKDVDKTKQRAIPLRNYLTNEVFYDTLHTEADRVIICSEYFSYVC